MGPCWLRYSWALTADCRASVGGGGCGIWRCAADGQGTHDEQGFSRRGPKPGGRSRRSAQTREASGGLVQEARWQDDAVSDSLCEPWLRGIAFNPAASADVLIRLLDEAAGEAGSLMCEGRDLPGAGIDAALRHPVERIRCALARNLYVDPARLAPLASDPSGLVRARLA